MNELFAELNQTVNFLKTAKLFITTTESMIFKERETFSRLSSKREIICLEKQIEKMHLRC